MKRKWKQLLSITLSVAITLTSFSPITLVSAQPIGETKEATTTAKYELYPTPHSVEYTGSSTTLKNQVQLVYGEKVDSYTKKKLDSVLKLKEGITATEGAAVDATKTNIIVGIKGSNDVADQYFTKNNLITDASIYEKYDAYTLVIKDNVIAILGKDADAAFYGVTTLKHIFRQAKGMELLNLTIKDYSDVQFRGFIEGYYGNPWSNEDRADLMTFGGEIKANTYIFAPKDDPYHNSKWREPYPEAELAEIAKLAKAGNESKCRYVWSIHPFMSSAFNFSSDATYKSDFKVITDKFTQLLQHGVRQFGVLADDAGAASTTNMVKLLTDLTTWLKEQQKTYPDLKVELPFCPAAYMGAYPDEKFSELPETVQIIQTGGRIWGEVSQEFSDNFYQNMGRAPYYWINWPCTDNSKQHLIMGGHNTFLHPGVSPEKIKGIVLNPMQQSEPSKAGIFLGASYAWNIWENEEQGDQTWNDMFDYIDHMNSNETDASLALKELCKHMINQNMDSRVDVLEESVVLAPKLNAFKDAYNKSQPVTEQATALIKEFEIINKAANTYKANASNTRFKNQIVHWLNAANDISKANIEFLKAVIALEKGENDNVWTHYSDGLALFEQSKTYTFPYVGTIQTAEFGVQHIVPFAKYLMQSLSGSVLGIVDPTKVTKSAITSRTDSPEGNISNILDNNPGTAVVWKNPTNIAVGTYVGVMFNRPVTINDVKVVLGAPSNVNDRFSASKLEYTEDGKVWKDVEGGTFANVEVAQKDGLNLTAKGIRLTATTEKANTWFGVKDFIVNKADYEVESSDDVILKGTIDRTARWEVNQGAEKNLYDGNDSTMVWYNVKNSDTSAVGEYLGYDFGKTEKIGKVHIVVGNDNGDKWLKYKLDYSTDGTTWTTLKTYTGKESGKDVIDEDFTSQGIQARYMRLVNTESRNKWIKFSEFRVEKADSLGLVKYTYTNKDALKTIKNTVTNNSFALAATNDITLAQGEYVGLKLDRIRDLKNISVEGNQQGLTLEYSNNAVEWTTASNPAEVGNGRYVRLINKTNNPVTFNLTSFVVNSNEISGPTFMESNIGGATSDVDARKNGDVKKIFDGNLFSSAKFAAPQVKDQFVKFDLGQEREIKTVTLSVLDTEKDYIRDGKIQVSLDGKQWTDVVVIGDGTDNAPSDTDLLSTSGWEHGKVNVAMAEAKGTLKESVKARYLRVVFTANYSHRWLVINEIDINDGEYVKTSNNPTFEATVLEERNFGPEKLFDGNLSSSYKPNMKGQTKGSLTYRLSDTTDVKQINILQNGNAISNATVSARVGAEEWVTLGTMDKSLNSFFNTTGKPVYELKLEWGNVSPMIYEMILLGEKHADVPSVDKEKEALQTVYEKAVAIKKGNYTDASWNNLQDKIKAAKTVLDNASADVNAITKAKANLNKAVADLTENVVPTKKFTVKTVVEGATNNGLILTGAGTYDEGTKVTISGDFAKDTIARKIVGVYEGTRKLADDLPYTFTVTKDITITVKVKETQNVTNGWLTSKDGKWQYSKEGTLVTSDWVLADGLWYYMGADSYMVTGWKQVGTSWYYFNPTSGVMVTGWVNDGGTWYYTNGSGAMVTGWQVIGGTWYYMNGSGVMLTGWQVIGGTWYYLNASGAMLTGWQAIGGTWYYLNASGAMLTGWQQLGGTWYYLAANGSMQTGWLDLGGVWYYLNRSGAMQTGWVIDGAFWYYLSPSSGAWTGAKQAV